MLNLAVLVSGGGSTMKKIGEACLFGDLRGLVELTLVVASKPGIGAIDKARGLGLSEDQIRVCDPKNFPTSEYFGEALLGLFGAYGITQIGQHGWLPLTPANVVTAFRGRIINQHPGPLDNGRPDFGGNGMYGRRVLCARLLYARQTGLPEDQFTEMTAHQVTPKFDVGQIVGWTSIPLRPGDTVESLQELALPAEHELHIAVLRQAALGELGHLERTHRLVPDERVELLEECKRLACLLYPHERSGSRHQLIPRS